MSTSNVTLLHTHPLRRAKAVRSLVLQKARWYGLPNELGAIVARQAMDTSWPATAAPDACCASPRSASASPRAPAPCRWPCMPRAAPPPRRNPWPSLLAGAALLAVAAAGLWLAAHDPWLPANLVARWLGGAA